MAVSIKCLRRRITEDRLTPFANRVTGKRERFDNEIKLPHVRRGGVGPLPVAGVGGTDEAESCER